MFNVDYIFTEPLTKLQCWYAACAINTTTWKNWPILQASRRDKSCVQLYRTMRERKSPKRIEKFTLLPREVR